MNILTAAEMREAEQQANARGLSYAQMMLYAGSGAARIIHERVENIEDKCVLVLVGPGNNGGDGLVCAGALAAKGTQVRCYLLKPRSMDDAVFASAVAQRVAMADAAGDNHLDQLRVWLTEADVVVDALLGTGTSRPIDGVLSAVLDLVRQRTPASLVALDGPTGMNYDTGTLDPAAVAADLTITFHAPKRGHYCFPAADARGELVVVPIGIEPFEISNFGFSIADDAMTRQLLPSRKLDSNKGTHGKALVIGGCADYLGAPTLTARAAYRVGAGLVAYAVPDAVKLMAALTCPEATFVPLPESTDTHNAQSLPRLEKWLASAGRAAVAIGPGMGQALASHKFFTGILRILNAGTVEPRGLVCDADALNMLATIDDWPKLLSPNTVLTPHAGEFARLAKMNIAAVQADRIGNAQKFAQLWGHVVLLKGAFTIIASPDGRGVVLPFSNPAMATAGSGDVLTGCIVGLMAQGLSAYDAAICGGYLHGNAGERWSNAHGDAGLLAGDLLSLLPSVIHALKQAS
jgi:NAD(P)H-hydrate epimerase